MSARTRIDGWTYLLAPFGLVTLGNAGWMLAAPVHWYHTLPAGVPDFGPLNEHFVRDIGSGFLVLGAALTWAAVAPAARVAVLAFVTLWNVAHAGVHVWDTVRGLVQPAHWGIDFPLVYLPTLCLVVVTAMLMRRPAPSV